MDTVPAPSECPTRMSRYNCVPRSYKEWDPESASEHNDTGEDISAAARPNQKTPKF